MHKLMELKEKLIDELGDYSENGKFSKEDVEAIKYISSGIDHICNIMEREDEGSYAMSSEGGSYEGGSYEGSYGGGSYGGSYRGGRGRGSYARGRGRNARRDSMGRYSRESGYSRAADDMVMELRELMEEAPDQQTKQEMERIVKRLETMK